MGSSARSLHDAGNDRTLERRSHRQVARRSRLTIRPNSPEPTSNPALLHHQQGHDHLRQNKLTKAGCSRVATFRYSGMSPPYSPPLRKREPITKSKFSSQMGSSSPPISSGASLLFPAITTAMSIARRWASANPS